MLNITCKHVAIFRRILKKFGKPTLPKPDAWKNATNDDVWIRVFSQVIVVGNAKPAKKLKKNEIKRRISWDKVSKIEEIEARTIIWDILREIGARYTGRDVQRCRKTNAMIHNLKYLKNFIGGPQGFIKHIANPELSGERKINFIMENLRFIKNKGSRDFLISGFGLIKNHIALDSRIINISKHVGIDIPSQYLSNKTTYSEIETDFITKICCPLGISGAEFDQLLFNNYGEIVAGFSAEKQTQLSLTKCCISA